MDQIAVVTGASRGIGKAIALHLAEANFRVACVSTRVEQASQVAEGLPGEGHLGFGCDIANSAAVDALTSGVVEKMGVPAALVNNAGITQDTLVLRMKNEDWDRVIQTNLTGTFYMIRAFSKAMMRARYGRIVNISSIIASTGAAGQANYAASKAGIEGLTRSVAKEYGSRGITCNAVAPGFIETDMTQSLPDELKDHVLKTSPAGRLGSGADVAALVTFLCSESSGYITGQVITVDGGLTL